MQSSDVRLMADSRLVKAALGTPLKIADFKKISDSWYWANDEVVLVVNLQKSQYGDQYYVNCGVALKALGAIEFPKEHQCHIRFRVEDAMPEEREKYVQSVLDLENDSFPDRQREDEISKLVSEVALPLLKGCSSKDGITESLRSGKLAKAMVYRQVKELVRN